MSFRLFGHDVEITASFWITTALMGYLAHQTNWRMVLLWVGVVLISILVHELGHALAFRMYGVPSSIQLYHMGGMTMPEGSPKLTRTRQIVVSLAGPLAGIALGLLVIGAGYFVPIRTPFVDAVLRMSLWVNIYWSFVNLLPVLPFDGGHVLEAALGPKRYRYTLGTSALVGTVISLLAIWDALENGGTWQLWIVILFGGAAFNSFRMLRDLQALVKNSGAAHDNARARQEPLLPATERALREAQIALDEGEAAKAVEMCDAVMAGKELENGERPKARAIQRALGIKGWAHLALDQIPEAAEAVTRLSRMAHTDPALLAAVAFAKEDYVPARRLLEAARASGDRRKEVFGPLIQILLKQNEAARAGALAFDCVDALSTDDLRAVGKLVSEGGSHPWGAKLLEAAFKRDRDPNDAFEAARVFARAGEPRRAIDLLRVAVQNGFTDVERVYADDALVSLDDLDDVVPKPGLPNPA
jgi:Zn-dependent protease